MAVELGQPDVRLGEDRLAGHEVLHDGAQHRGLEQVPLARVGLGDRDEVGSTPSMANRRIARGEGRAASDSDRSTAPRIEPTSRVSPRQHGARVDNRLQAAQLDRGIGQRHGSRYGDVVPKGMRNRLGTLVARRPGPADD